MSKWIGASIGWAFLGPIGGILGLVLGSMFEPVSKKKSSSFHLLEGGFLKYYFT